MSGDNVLGDFLKARRGRLRADEAGLRSFGRRRVPGLRRDELACLAGVSPHYLTRLEQGTDRHPSTQVLQALATALRLDHDETAYLYALAAPPVTHQRVAASDDIQQLLDSWSDTAAYVRNRRFDVLAANNLAMALSPLYSPGENLVRGIFLDPSVRTLFPDWPEVAAHTAAALRSETDPRDAATAELVASMPANSDFSRMWADHRVRPVRDELKRFDHPTVGALTLRRQALTIAGAEDQVIITYRAAPGSSSAKALRRLI